MPHSFSNIETSACPFESYRGTKFVTTVLRRDNLTHQQHFLPLPRIFPPMAQNEELKVIVIGAGSAGLLLAQGLKQVRSLFTHLLPSLCC